MHDFSGNSTEKQWIDNITRCAKVVKLQSAFDHSKELYNCSEACKSLIKAGILVGLTTLYKQD